MGFKQVICRKNYICTECKGTIFKGELSLVGSDRIPRYDDNDNQIGIEYVKWRVHPEITFCNYGVIKIIPTLQIV